MCNKMARHVPFYRTVIARLHQKKFTYVIPLGITCETAFRFYHTWRFLDSSLFSWVGSLSLEALTKVIDDLSVFMTGPARLSPSTHCWICLNTNFGLHGKLEVGKEYTQEQVDADLKDLRGRIEYLKQKFIKALQSGKSILFAHRLSRDDMASPDLGNRLDALQRTLEKLGAKDYTLLVICEKPYLDKMPPGKNREFRAVRVFNPPDRVVDHDIGDGVGWHAIFTEFAPAKILPKAHKFKFE